jgi:beta-phosphoglucomutase-like phosphatase (HAD superfamily)
VVVPAAATLWAGAERHHVADSVAHVGAPVELVIFDCDGVLVDSERLAVRVESTLITELGWPLDEQDVLERFVGRSDEYLRAEIERALGRPAPEWETRSRGALERAFRSELTAVEGIVDALDAIEAAGLATCVASSGTHDKMRLTLGLTGLYERFEGVATVVFSEMSRLPQLLD